MFDTANTMADHEQEVSLFCSSVSELNAQAVAQISQINPEIPIDEYFNYARKLLQHAGQSKQNRDIERTYMFMVQYLIFIVKRLPEHPQFDEDSEEYKYNSEKCDAIKEQLAKIRERLEELYEEVHEVEPDANENEEAAARPEDLCSTNDEPPHEEETEDEQQFVQTPQDENFDQVAIAHDDEDIIVYIRNPKIMPDYFKADDIPEPYDVVKVNGGVSEILPQYSNKSPNQLRQPSTVVHQQPQQQEVQPSMTQSLHQPSSFLNIHTTHGYKSESFEQAPPLMTQSFTMGNTKKRGGPRPLPGIAMKPSSRIIESSSTKNAAKLILDSARVNEPQPRQVPRPSQSSSFMQPRPQSQQYSVPTQMQQSRPQSQQFGAPMQQQSRSQNYAPQQFTPQEQPQYIPPQIQNRSQSLIQPRHQNLSVSDQIVQKGMERVVMNDNVQQKVGNKIGEWAENEEIQGRVGDTVSNIANNKQYQNFIGESIARNSDNVIVCNIARNEQVQSVVGTTISNTVENKEVQKAVGGAVKKMATDRETQQKVAKGFMTVAKGAWTGTKTIGKFAYDQYNSEQ